MSASRDSSPSSACKPAPTAEELRKRGLCGCVFKDAHCGYQGVADWCDHSRARCAEIGNLKRFDGAGPPLRAPLQLHVIDFLLLALCGVCWWYAWPWPTAAMVYTFSFLFLIPPVRDRVILGWWALLERRKTSDTETKD